MSRDWIETPEAEPEAEPRAPLHPDAVPYAGSMEKLRELWRKHGHRDNAKDLVGKEFNDWKREHGFPYDGDGR